MRVTLMPIDLAASSSPRMAAQARPMRETRKRPISTTESSTAPAKT